RDLLGRAALCPGHHRGVPGACALPLHGASGVRRPRDDAGGTARGRVLTENRIEIVPSEQAGELKPDLLRLVPGPLRSCGQAVTAHTRAEYWLDEIRADLEAPSSELLLARPRGRTAGLAVLADLAWESRVLGR